ncbi:hypothetical protein C8F04DRAFT_272289 [Mycena alexandri]|uniref:Zn(2)-C6 fungal-type domain-containing protein n=1 Tax=Mycena alexandri TaxID=1745969 RepID=A0AAD6T8W6_9AGAR|nr:hypothetical protein C8F04DRAFT_272289 [Mycena alexandri]
MADLPLNSKLFTKRRRAYVACQNCRKRKIKCYAASEGDFGPCGRCIAKGAQCLYYAVPEEYLYPSSLPATPPEEIYSQPRRLSTPDYRDCVPTITPPSAGISGLLHPRPFRERSSTIPPLGVSLRFPYERKRSPSTAISKCRRNSQPPLPPSHEQQGLSPQISFVVSHSRTTPEYHPGPAPHCNRGPVYNARNNTFPWTNPLFCICPPGPCYCGANLSGR